MEKGRECLGCHLGVGLNSFLINWLVRMRPLCRSNLRCRSFVNLCVVCRVVARSRKDFVDAYLLYVFSDSVSEQYSAFSSGFLKVCGGEILALFQPCELMAMVVGNNNYNWEEMEKVSVQFQSYSTVVLQAVTVLREKYLVCFSHLCAGHVSLGVFIMKKKISLLH